MQKDRLASNKLQDAIFIEGSRALAVVKNDNIFVFRLTPAYRGCKPHMNSSVLCSL